MITKRSPFCGYNTTQCVELSGGDLLRYSNNVESNDLRQFAYRKLNIHSKLTDKAYLSDITARNISESFTHKMAAKKTSWNEMTS